MNVSSVSLNQVMQTSSSQSNSAALTAAQKSLIEETLAEYDVDNLSKSDAQEIVKSFEEAGIQPSAALESAMSTAGFDAKEVGTMAAVGPQGGGGGRPMGPPPPASEEELSAIEELLESLLSIEEDEESESTTTSSSVSSFENILDYTYKVVNLKEDAKAEVMDILNKYNSEDNIHSQEETQAYIVNSLSQIFNEPDNFNSFSFYA